MAVKLEFYQENSSSTDEIFKTSILNHKINCRKRKVKNRIHNGRSNSYKDG